METWFCLVLVLGVSSEAHSAPAPDVSRSAHAGDADVTAGFYRSPLDEAYLSDLHKSVPMHKQVPNGNRITNGAGVPMGEGIVLYKRNSRATEKKQKHRPGEWGSLIRPEESKNFVPEIEATQIPFGYGHLPGAN